MASTGLQRTAHAKQVSRRSRMVWLMVEPSMAWLPFEGAAGPVASCQSTVLGCPGDRASSARLAEHINILVLNVFELPSGPNA